MANHKQTKKRARQTKKRRLRNMAIRSYTRKTVSRVRAAVAAGDVATAEQALGVAISTLDKSVTKNVMKRTTASRTISRLTKAVNALKASSAQ